MLRHKIALLKSPEIMPKATRQDAAEELETALLRPDIKQLQQQILEIVEGENQPTTAERILSILKQQDQFNVYMSDIARAIWRMVANGSIVVESGKIQPIDLLEDLSGARRTSDQSSSAPPMTCESNWDYILSPSGGYEIAEDASLHDGCQLVNGVWWAPVFGCDSLETTLERIRERLQRQAAPVAVPSERLRKSQSISSAAQEVLESVASAPTAAAALRAVVQQIDHSWDGAECVDFLQAIAAELGAIIEIDPGPRPVNLSELHDPEFSDGGPNYFPLTS